MSITKNHESLYVTVLDNPLPPKKSREVRMEVLSIKI